jgi:hypothetical protein
MAHLARPGPRTVSQIQPRSMTMHAFEVPNSFFVERSILRNSEFCRVGGAIDALNEAQNLFAAVLTLAPKASVRLRRGSQIFAEAHYGNVVRHDPPRQLNTGW